MENAEKEAKVELSQSQENKVTATAPGEPHASPQNEVKQANRINSLQETISKVLEEFDTKLFSADQVSILRKMKPANDNPFQGKFGHLVQIGGESAGLLVSPIEGNCTVCKWTCYERVPSGNDPIAYQLYNLRNDELMSVYGMDDLGDTESRVKIFLSSLRTYIGSICYGYEGIDNSSKDIENISLFTHPSNNSYRKKIPTSILGAAGELAFIFRQQKNTTEILTADGAAIVVAKIRTEPAKKSTSAKRFGRQKQGVVITYTECILPSDKALILAASIVMFNKVQRKEKNSQSCTIS